MSKICLPGQEERSVDSVLFREVVEEIKILDVNVEANGTKYYRLQFILNPDCNIIAQVRFSVDGSRVWFKIEGDNDQDALLRFAYFIQKVEWLKSVVEISHEVKVVEARASYEASQKRMDQLYEDAGLPIPTRVLVGEERSEAVTPYTAFKEYGIIPTMIYERKDGFMLGADGKEVFYAYEMWKDEWVKVHIGSGISANLEAPKSKPVTTSKKKKS